MNADERLARARAKHQQDEHERGARAIRQQAEDVMRSLDMNGSFNENVDKIVGLIYDTRRQMCVDVLLALNQND